MAVSTQRLPIDPRLGKSIDDLRAAGAQQMHDHRNRSNLYQYDMIQPDTVEAIFQCQATLDLICLDHGDQDVTHDERSVSRNCRSAGQPVGNGKYATEIIRGMPPFRRQPGIVEVEPPYHGSDIERCLDRVELE